MLFHRQSKVNGISDPMVVPNSGENKDDLMSSLMSPKKSSSRQESEFKLARGATEGFCIALYSLSP